MANTKYDQLTMYVLPEVQGCSDPMAEQAIRDAAVEFCQRSMVWVYSADPQSVIAGRSNYDVETPAGASLVQIKSVQVTNQMEPLDPLSTDQLDLMIPNWDTETGTPKAYTQQEDAEFIIAPVPDETIKNGLRIMLTLQPSRASTGYPDWINNKYQECVLAGAKSRLMMKQGTHWYNPNQGMAYKAEFDLGIAKAKESSTLSFVRTALRTTSRH
jgi:hypothetical protein